MPSSPVDKTPSDEPGAGTPLNPHSASLFERTRHRIERVNESIEAAGLSVHGASFLLIWWKRLGFARGLSLLALFVLPAGGYSTLLYSASRSIPDWVGDFGVRFDAKEAHIDLFHLRVVTRDVTLRADERSEPVLSATEVAFQGSLGTFFKGLFGPGAFYNEITIRQGELHLERSLTGDWNIDEFIARVPPERRADALAGLYQVRGLYLEDLKIVYTEHVPGNSGSGVIQTAQATVYVDDVNGWVRDLVQAAQPGEQPTLYQFKGRSADGIVQIKGSAGLFGNGDDSSGPGGITRVSTGADLSTVATGLGNASFQMNVYLENIGLGAYARMVPTTRLLPIKGSLRGTVDVGRSPAGGLVCKANMGAENLEFAPNPRLVVVKEQFAMLERNLAGYRVSGPFDPCGGEEPDPRQPLGSPSTMTAVLASFNAQTTQSAPPVVRAFAVADQRQVAGVGAEAAMADVMNIVAGRVGGRVTRLVGQQTGQALERSLASEPASGEGNGANPLTRGVKGIGGGFRRLFGGGEKGDKK